MRRARGGVAHGGPSTTPTHVRCVPFAVPPPLHGTLANNTVKGSELMLYFFTWRAGDGAWEGGGGGTTTSRTMFPIPLLSGGDPSRTRSRRGTRCPRPPLVAHKFVEASLLETGLLAHAAKESLAAGRLDDSVAYVERLVAKLVPLGKLVDEQMHVHGGRQRSRAGILAADATDAALAACGAFPDSSEWPREGPTDVPDDRAVRRWFSLMKRVGEVRTCARGVPLPPCRCARTGMPARAAAGPGSVVCPPCVPVYVLVDNAVLVVR